MTELTFTSWKRWQEVGSWCLALQSAVACILPVDLDNARVASNAVTSKRALIVARKSKGKIQDCHDHLE